MTAPIMREKVYTTEEMSYHQRLYEYAIKHGVTKATRRYHTNRRFMTKESDPLPPTQEVRWHCLESGIEEPTASSPQASA